MSEYELSADELAALTTGNVPPNSGLRQSMFGDAQETELNETITQDGHLQRERDAWGTAIQATYGQLMTTFAKGMAAQLQEPLRTDVSLAVQSTREAIYGELIIRMDNPTCVQLLSATPLTADYVFEMHPTVLFPVFDRLLGGGALPTPVLRRPLTEIESRLSGRVTRLAAAELAKAWSAIMSLQIAGTRLVGNPRMLRSENPNEPMIVTEFLYSMADCEGPIRLAIRKSALLEVADKLRDMVRADQA